MFGNEGGERNEPQVEEKGEGGPPNPESSSLLQLFRTWGISTGHEGYLPLLSMLSTRENANSPVELAELLNESSIPWSLIIREAKDLQIKFKLKSKWL